MKRRTFLQSFSSILAVLSAVETGWLTLGSRYYQALAQSVPRKLALLVGINQYPQSPVLTGCLTDVELQRELLIHRFGFRASDIVSLTDAQATRESIETAFFEHLVKQAKPDDVVVFHYSGYGSRIKLETQETEQNALVPVDEINTQETKTVNYLLEETLLLMLRSLSTNHIAAVLDTSYYAPSNSLPTNLGIRSCPGPGQAILLAEELELQKQLQEKASSEQSAVVLCATSLPEQLAREQQFSGFSAGLFTHALTQYLWEATPTTTIQVCLSDIAGSIQQLGSTKQQPALLLDPKNQLSRTSITNILLASSTYAEGVVTGVEDDGKTILLWLGGLPAPVLEYYGVNSRLTLVTKEESNNVELVVKSRAGLSAKAQISIPESTTSLQVGQLVQEAVRVIPRKISLTIALNELERIERVDATSAFATPYVSSVIAGEQPADYLFGRLPQAKNKDLAATNSTVVSPTPYGLFSLGGELIPNTAGDAGEAVKTAAQRLGAKLQTLLAAKLWRLTENAGSSRLGIKATLELIGALTPRALIQRETLRTQSTETSNNKASVPQLGSLTTVSVGSKIQYRVENISDRPVYLMLLALNSSRTAIALFPWCKSTESEPSKVQPVLKDIVISPGETLTIPQTTSGFEWVVQEPTSLSETQLIFSTAPFTQSLLALEAAKPPKTEQHRIHPLIAPLEVTQALLQDLHNASAVSDINSTVTDSYVLDVNHWASLSFVYQVV
ncbi:caspase family protein [Brasilonema sp. UFV-L1]|uniref:caspase family protein n=1 Tax=Brasilonema sp. UFV-L1 TaxID=2234130 RepID=UPI00145CBC3D|nr:caspase family protein [Brasilonema sp. UFV-L1]NMG06838.1 peptidase C14 [Brasilonema sp. UFV-L1]